jgi:hypothetical protein
MLPILIRIAGRDMRTLCSRASKAILFGALALLAAGCAGSDSPRRQKVVDAISGAWVNDRSLVDRSGWREMLTVLDGLAAPEPLELVIHPDGSFVAHYGAKEFRTFMRIVGQTDLENPLKGHYELGLDWSGAAWINFDPGAPERRITMDKGRITLHGSGEIWRSEIYRRDDAGGERGN